MLGKVLKHDIKTCARYYLPMYLLFAVVVFINKVYLLINPKNSTVSNAFRGTIISSYVFCLIGVVLLTEIFLVIHFYRKCISREGYLTFTLPVKTGTHLLSKCINSALWHIISYGCIVLSLVIFLSPDEWNIIRALLRIISMPFSTINITGFTTFLILTALTRLFTAPLIFFASMSMGQIVTRHKILASIGFYLAFYIVFSMISSFGSSFLYIGAEVIFSGNESISLMVLSAFSFLLALLQACLYYFLSYFFLDRKLNLT